MWLYHTSIHAQTCLPHKFGELNVKRGGKGIRIMELEGDDFSQQFVKCQSGGGVWTSNGETRGRATSYRVCGQKIQPFKRGQSPILHGSLQHGDGCSWRKRCVEVGVLLSDRGSSDIRGSIYMCAYEYII
mgnify:CR=1 FL=1